VSTLDDERRENPYVQEAPRRQYQNERPRRVKARPSKLQQRIAAGSYFATSAFGFSAAGSWAPST
jgi:hypothetical protein